MASFKSIKHVLIFVYCIIFPVVLLNLLGCKKKEAAPESPINKLLDTESKCRISSFKTGAGRILSKLHYESDNLVSVAGTVTYQSGLVEEYKRFVTYNQYGNPVNHNNLIFFSYDKDNLLESVTRYTTGNIRRGFEIDTIKEYKAYFKWEKGNIVSIRECFVRANWSVDKKYEYEDLPPWCTTNFKYDSSRNTVTAERTEGTLRYSLIYEFDENPNPLRSLYILSGDYRFDQQVLFKNNCTKRIGKMEDGKVFEFDYLYKYDENNNPTNGFWGDDPSFDIRYECQ